MFHSGTNKTVLLIRAVLVVFALYTFDVAAQELLPEANAESLASRIDMLIDSGRKSLQAGDVETAVRAYQEVLRLDPNKAEALYQLAIYHFRKKDYAKGLELIKKAVEASPENPFPRMALAKALGETGDYDEAIKQYEQVLKAIDPDSRPGQTALLEMNILRFRQAARRRDREQVFQIGQQLTQKYKANPTVLELVASVYVQAGFVQQAKELYEELLKYTPDNPAIEFYLAGAYERLRNPEQAMLHYERAIDKGEGSPVAQSAQIKLGLLHFMVLSCVVLLKLFNI
jgi:tetratricopeptide (TPR) repeat protein